MRTGRTVTIFRWRTPPPNLEEPPLKNWRPPRKIGDSRKIGDPLKNWRPPRKFGGTPPKLETPGTPLGPPGTRPPTPSPRGHNDTRFWKYYLGQNFVSAGKNSNQPELAIHCFAGKFRFDFKCLRIQKCLHANSDIFYAIFYLLRRNLDKKTSRSERISHAGSPLTLLLTQLSLGHYMTNRTMVRSEERINDKVGAHKIAPNQDFSCH